MRIKDLRSETNAGRARVAATVIWEDCDRPTHDVYFEADEAFADGLSCNPHAFLVGCAIPAMHFGEDRVFIDAEICPELRLGLIEAMSWLRHWYYEPDRPLVRIEAQTRSAPPSPRTPERAGFFFSGGIDSFATLRTNRLTFPAEHPWSIKDGVVVFGLELDTKEAFDYVLELLSPLARQLGINLIPVYTNLYLNYRYEDARNHFKFWLSEYQGAVFGALAHVLSRRFTVMSIAASDDISDLTPYGTHPLLDPHYSSYDLRIRHDGIALSRLTRTALIADWDVALQNLRVCNQFKRYRPGRLNCGRCEKCIRTMLALVALGKLDQTHSFPRQDIDEETVISIKHFTPDVILHYRELIAPLEKVGRSDLARAIKFKIAECEKRQKNAARRMKIKTLLQPWR
jgi:hypothetical protein